MNLRALIRTSAGLDLPQAAIERALRELGLDAADQALRPGRPGFDALLERVVVPESWMLRDPAVFEAALAFVRRRLLDRPDAVVRILSLPCAGGEEPYSMALALADGGVEAARCRIDGVDLSRTAIERACLGRYTSNAFRGADLAFRARWFTRDGDDYLIDPLLRDYVRLRQGNLFAPDAHAPAGGYDLVLCRNLLIYFDEAGQRRAAAAVAGLLAGDGLLLSGYAEAPAFCRHGFAPVPGGGVFALHKVDEVRVDEARTAAQPPAPARMPAPAPARARAAPPHPAPRQGAADPAPQALLARAQRLADAGQLAEAQADCRAALARYPEYADAWFLLGLMSDCAGDATGERGAAERCWRRCLYLQPDHYEALCSLALLHERRGDGARGANLRQRAARIFARRGGGPA